MPIPEIRRVDAESKVKAFCDSRIPTDLKEQIKLSISMKGNAITLHEERPPWTGKGSWSKLAIAQFRYDEKRNDWTLYCADRNDKWHRYVDTDSTPDINELLKEVDKDPTGIFWG